MLASGGSVRNQAHTVAVAHGQLQAEDTHDDKDTNDTLGEGTHDDTNVHQLHMLVSIITVHPCNVHSGAKAA